MRKLVTDFLPKLYNTQFWQNLIVWVKIMCRIEILRFRSSMYTGGDLPPLSRNVISFSFPYFFSIYSDRSGIQLNQLKCNNKEKYLTSSYHLLFFSIFCCFFFLSRCVCFFVCLIFIYARMYIAAYFITSVWSNMLELDCKACTRSPCMFKR